MEAQPSAKHGSEYVLEDSHDSQNPMPLESYEQP